MREYSPSTPSKEPKPFDQLRRKTRMLHIAKRAEEASSVAGGFGAVGPAADQVVEKRRQKDPKDRHTQHPA